MRVFLQHVSTYRYPSPAVLGVHTIRLKPAAHARARVESYGLTVGGGAHVVWQQDPAGNFVAHARFAGPTDALEIGVEIAIDLQPVNPFDFVLHPSAEHLPIAYGPLAGELSPYLALDRAAFTRGPRFEALREATSPSGDVRTIDWLVSLNQSVASRVRYVLREEAGVFTPEQTLSEGRGSCRDSAVLLAALLRSHGLAARFVSGYLVQLTDEGMLPDEPKGLAKDVVDLHAWAEVFLPGAGWLGLDATSGLFAGEGHIPLACTASPEHAAAIEGTSGVLADDVQFHTRVTRLGHEVRPTAPFTEEAWRSLVDAGARTDEALRAMGVALTIGGEPTFNSRLHPERPEWNGDALGPTKWSQGLAFARAIQRRLQPGGAMLLRQGKSYPGETLPRWALELIARTDGRAIWRDLPRHRTDRGQLADVAHDAQPGVARGRDDAALLPHAATLAHAIAERLALSGYVAPLFEDPRWAVEAESEIDREIDARHAKLDDDEERRRLARWLDRGLASEAGFVIPIAPRGAGWESERWQTRRDRLYLLPGDAPAGLRLPLRSLGGAASVTIDEPTIEPPDPRGPEAARRTEDEERARLSRLVDRGHLPESARPARRTTPSIDARIRTALVVEPRGGTLCVFLPPMPNAARALALIEAIDHARDAVPLEVLLEGYPPKGPELASFTLTPDPGVLEVNLPPVASFDAHASLIDRVFDAALETGLHAEKYLLDGRQAGSGGGNHITLGGARAIESPFVRDPKLLASLVTFVQHHPALSYLFSGLFVGPTSQAPRVDEARHDSLYELEIALARAFASRGDTPPWLADLLFRDLLVDVTGNTHRAEICIDKLFDFRTPHGRQGVIELRAFEMPPHPRMMSAQTELVRTIVAALAKRPYDQPLVRWGTTLHDRFLLPTFLWRDMEDVLAFLSRESLALPSEVYRAFLELRCPLAGRLEAEDVTVEIRNTLEPWPVLGEEPQGGGTSRFVDSSVERVEVRAEGLVPERHVVLINGHVLPMRATGRAGEGVAGVRFRAWAPPRSLHAHLGVHHPLRIDVLDRWSSRSLGACGYHVFHPEGRAYTAQPLTRFEAMARRSQRFTIEAPLRTPVIPTAARTHDDTAWTLDLRRYAIDHPMPVPSDPE